MSRRIDYDFGDQLGRGSFGVVYMVTRRSDARCCVCKEIALTKMSKRAREEANQEVSLLRRVSSGSDYIVQYMGSFLEDDHLHIIMEFCERGDLSQFLKARETQLVEEQVVWKFVIQIALGLRWLHRNRILHRDIKTLNVFLTSNNDVRLGDLGVAKILSEQTNFANTFVGTPYYLSPELCEEKPYNELSDVWAFGCVIYEMCTLRHPFEAKNHAALLIKILRGQYAPIDVRYSDDMRGLIDNCMRREWTKRTKLADTLMKPNIRSWAEKLELSLESAESDTPLAAADPADAQRRHPPRMPVRTSPRASGSAPSSKATSKPSSAAPKAVGRASSEKALLREEPPPVPGRIVSGPITRRVRHQPVIGRRASEDVLSTRTATLVAPVSGNAAAQVIRSAPGRASASRPAVPAGARTGANGEASPSKRDAVKLSARSEPGSGEERRRAAREVADLPDVVVAHVRPSRNVPSVQQLLKLDDSPVKALLARHAARGPARGPTGMSPDPEVSTMTPEEARRLSAAEDEATIRPAEVEEEVEQDELPEWDGPEEEYPEEEYPDGSASECDSPAPLGAMRLLQPRRSGSGLLEGGELTHGSAFDGEDSLMYTLEDTDASRMFESSSRSRASSRGDRTGPLLGVEVKWDIEADRAASQMRLTAKLDSDGLLCDAEVWHVGPRGAPLGLGQGDPPEVEEEVGVDEEEPRAQPVPEKEPVLPEPLRLPTKTRAAPDPRAQVARLKAQISRLYADVVQDLDAPARTVWDELYALFQAKMAIDLTDEDQSEIERYVFEQLPTESTDLIWKVYKVLHLEQERDRWQRLAEASG